MRNSGIRIYKRGLFLVLALVFALAALAACGAKDAKSAESPASSAAPAKEAKALALGEAGRTDELEITVTKAEKAAEWINGPPEGHVYIVVSFKITNISKEEQSVAASDFQYVKDGMRESYERTTGVKADPTRSAARTSRPKTPLRAAWSTPSPRTCTRWSFTTSKATAQILI